MLLKCLKKNRVRKLFELILSKEKKKQFRLTPKIFGLHIRRKVSKHYIIRKKKFRTQTKKMFRILNKNRTMRIFGKKEFRLCKKNSVKEKFRIII